MRTLRAVVGGVLLLSVTFGLASAQNTTMRRPHRRWGGRRGGPDDHRRLVRGPG